MNVVVPTFGMLAVLALMGGLVLCIILVANEKTRKAGLILLGIGTALLLGAVVLGVGFVSLARQEAVPVMSSPSATYDQELQQILQPRIPLRETADHAASAHPPATAEAPAEAETAAEPGTATDNVSATTDDAEGAPEPTASGSGDAIRTDAASTAIEQPALRPRPSWIGEGPKRIGSVWREVVSTTPYERRHDAQDELERKVILATGEVIDDVLGRNYLSRFTSEDISLEMAQYLLRDLNLLPGDIWEKYAIEEYKEPGSIVAERPTYRFHVLLEFDEQDRRELADRWRQHQSMDRMQGVAVGAVIILGVLAAIFGVLKWDTATKGYYTRRLIIGGAVATMIAVALAVTLN